jgi:uncharacterized protein YndB with AHSA1/START domain
MYSIDKTIQIDAPIQRIVEALTTEAGYRGWFTQSATFDGAHATFTFPRPEITRKVTFRIDRCDAAGVAMTCTAEENNPAWRGTTLAITVQGEGVRLVHSGYPAKDDYYEQCVAGWEHFLPSLKSYVESGRGTPLPATC